MSKYKFQRGGFGTPISGYTDYHFADVGEVRRERYLQNFYTTEAMRQSADSLEAAPFDGDQQYRENLLTSTDNVLGMIAERGDYENMTVAVNRAATEYQKRTIPLAKNLKNYQDYLAKMEKDHNDKKIDYEDYMGTLQLSTAFYGGIQTDETGQVKGDSLFVGLDPVYNPDINKMLRDQLNSMVPFEVKGVSRRVGQGDEAQFEVETNQGIKYIDAARVEEAMASVMRDPQVQAYIGRKSLIRTGLLNDEQLAAKFQNDMEMVANDLKNVDAKLSAGVTAAEEGALMSRKTRLLQHLGMMQQASQDPEEMRKMAQASEVTKLNNMYRDSMLSRYVYQQEESGTKVFWDDIFKKRFEQDLDFMQAYPALTWESEVISQANIYGANDLEAAEKRKGFEKVYLDLLKEAEKFAGDGVSDEEKAKYQRSVADAWMAVQRADEYFLWRYGMTNPDLYNTEEYKALERRYDEAKANSLKPATDPNGNRYFFIPTGSMSLVGQTTGGYEANYYKYQGIKREMDDYIAKNAKNDPLRIMNQQVKFSSARSNPFFQSKDGQKMAISIDKALMQLFTAPPATLPIYEPNTTELTTFRDATNYASVDNAEYRSRIDADDDEMTMIPPDAKYASHGISFTPPNPFLGPMIQINYTSETRGTGSYNVPLNSAVEIPALNAIFGTPHMEAVSEIGAFEAVPDISAEYETGNAMERRIPVYSSVADKPAMLHVRYASAGPQAKIVPLGTNPAAREWLNAYGDQFANAMNEMDFRIRPQSGR